MMRTNIEIDDVLVDRAMRIYRLASKREAVDFALRKLVGEPMRHEEMLAGRGGKRPSATPKVGPWDGAELATTDIVMMEILAGLAARRDRDWLRRFMYGHRFLAVEGPADYENAAELYRLCRRAGETPRKLADCLVAVVAMRNDVELLAGDADFQVIARHAPLKLATA